MTELFNAHQRTTLPQCNKTNHGLFAFMCKTMLYMMDGVQRHMIDHGIASSQYTRYYEQHGTFEGFDFAEQARLAILIHLAA